MYSLDGSLVRTVITCNADVDIGSMFMVADATNGLNDKTMTA